LAKSWPDKGPPASWWRRGSRRSRSGRASPRACEGPRRCPRSLRLVQLGFALPREHILGDDPRRSGDARPGTRPRRAESWPWGAAKPVVEHLVLARARRARSGAWPTSPIREMHRIGRSGRPTELGCTAPASRLRWARLGSNASFCARFWAELCGACVRRREWKFVSRCTPGPLGQDEWRPSFGRSRRDVRWPNAFR
jgi:hypothetical protein